MGPANTSSVFCTFPCVKSFFMFLLSRSHQIIDKLLCGSSGKPAKKEFQEIVKTLAQRNELAIPEEELLLEANKWELSHGGLSGRTAQQFIDYLMVERDYAFLGRRLASCKSEIPECRGVVAVLEGGYNTSSLARSCAAFIHQLACTD